MTYWDLFQTLKIINNGYYHDEIIYEFMYDDLIFDKLSFLSFKYELKKDYLVIIKKFKNCIENNIPWERILGYCYFYNIKIKLNSNVFSPRKDTELLVDLVLKDTKHLKCIKYLDLGTGSGCISVALAKNVHYSSQVIGFENNIDAFNNTKENIEILNLKNATVKYDDYLTLMKEKKLDDFDVLVCNPPYISRSFKLENNVVNFDPESALFADENGYEYYFKIFEYIKDLKNKTCYFEIGFNQEEVLIKKLRNLNINSYNISKDMSNNPRILKIEL